MLPVAAETRWSLTTKVTTKPLDACGHDCTGLDTDALVLDLLGRVRMRCAELRIRRLGFDGVSVVSAAVRAVGLRSHPFITRYGLSGVLTREIPPRVRVVNKRRSASYPLSVTSVSRRSTRSTSVRCRRRSSLQP